MKIAWVVCLAHAKMQLADRVFEMISGDGSVSSVFDGRKFASKHELCPRLLAVMAKQQQQSSSLSESSKFLV